MSEFDPYQVSYGMKPKPKTWLKHAGLLFATFITSTIAGSIYPFGPILPFSFFARDPSLGIVGTILALPLEYIDLVAAAVVALVTRPEILYYGLSFSVSALFILIAHEAGHYIACRIYRVGATLPFFIPTPPLLGPAGTLGAFIKIVSPMPSRKAIFDI